jgi:hypothetical protein
MATLITCGGTVNTIVKPAVIKDYYLFSLKDAISPPLKSDDPLIKILIDYYRTSFYTIYAAENAPSTIKVGNHTLPPWPKASYKTYIHATELNRQILDMIVAVHEMHHAYEGKYRYLLMDKFGLSMTGMYQYEYYAIDETLGILVPHGKTFPARELTNFIPSELRTSFFKIYIAPSSDNQATQNTGIFGLLGEYSAFFQDASFSFALFDYFNGLNNPNEKDWQTFLWGISTVHESYSQFRFWILSYLLYAKKEHPSVYEDILSNSGFKYAFSEIDKRFTALIVSMNKVMEKTGAAVSKLKYKFSYQGEKVLLINTFYTISMKDYNKLTPELNRPEYKEMLAKLYSY